MAAATANTHPDRLRDSLTAWAALGAALEALRGSGAYADSPARSNPAPHETLEVHPPHPDTGLQPSGAGPLLIADRWFVHGAYADSQAQRRPEPHETSEVHPPHPDTVPQPRFVGSNQQRIPSFVQQIDRRTVPMNHADWGQHEHQRVLHSGLNPNGPTPASGSALLYSAERLQAHFEQTMLPHRRNRANRQRAMVLVEQDRLLSAARRRIKPPIDMEKIAASLPTAARAA